MFHLLQRIFLVCHNFVEIIKYFLNSMLIVVMSNRNIPRRLIFKASLARVFMFFPTFSIKTTFMLSILQQILHSQYWSFDIQDLLMSLLKLLDQYLVIVVYHVIIQLLLCFVNHAVWGRHVSFLSLLLSLFTLVLLILFSQIFGVQLH